MSDLWFLCKLFLKFRVQLDNNPVFIQTVKLFFEIFRLVGWIEQNEFWQKWLLIINNMGGGGQAGFARFQKY